MAWRLTSYLTEATLDNTTPGRITGQLRFVGRDQPVTLDLEGNFHRDIRGASIQLRGEGAAAEPNEAATALDGFASEQTGQAGDMTAGRPPADYVDYPYFEWYSDANGRVVLELQTDQLQLLTPPIPAVESDPLDPARSQQLMRGFLREISEATGAATLAVPLPHPPHASDTESGGHDDPMPVISAYSRAQAIEDGVLVDLTAWAKDLGYRDAVACTQAVWSNLLTPPPDLVEGHGQSVRGRAHDLLWMLLTAIRGLSRDHPIREVAFEVRFLKTPSRTDVVRLVAHRGPGDRGEPVLTIMLPTEN